MEARVAISHQVAIGHDEPRADAADAHVAAMGHWQTKVELRRGAWFVGGSHRG
jgi:hypothetical protein